MSTMPDTSLEDARKVKPVAGEAARRAGRVLGIGLSKVGNAYVIKVNFASHPLESARLPSVIDGVGVVYEVVGSVSKRAMR